MKKTVDLRIKSSQYEETLQPSGEAFARELELDESFEIRTTGTLYTKGAATYIAYEETEKMGLENNRTLIKLIPEKEVSYEYEDKKTGELLVRNKKQPQALSIRRYHENSEDDMDMLLHPGQLCITRYKVPQLAAMDLEIYTIKVEANIDEAGYGDILAEYRIKFDDLFSRRTILEIEVRPE